uniref:Uncharacterized protein n=1 Tax=Toxoplasma gondii (strain ATCC 50861 / VEG) TaxID=432359 RepID=A0A0F7UTU0_TOXGV|nr:TPA: hypothetical protein BN1205_010160 [Toxoplasma gondii VEG]
MEKKLTQHVRRHMDTRVLPLPRMKMSILRDSAWLKNACRSRRRQSISSLPSACGTPLVSTSDLREAEVVWRSQAGTCIHSLSEVRLPGILIRTRRQSQQVDTSSAAFPEQGATRLENFQVNEQLRPAVVSSDSNRTRERSEGDSIWWMYVVH